MRPPSHDQRKCAFIAPNPNVDRAAIPFERRQGAPLFLCYAKGDPLITTMRKCRYCRDNRLWYKPAPDSPDFVPLASVSE
ncbi:MAG TPA: hypothetical protein VNL92_06185 [Dehalococcoidia bacterium]|nr:hypothetical protein [Dehalococcoidia bacterium]